MPIYHWKEVECVDLGEIGMGSMIRVTSAKGTFSLSQVLETVVGNSVCKDIYMKQIGSKEYRMVDVIRQLTKGEPFMLDSPRDLIAKIEILA